MPPDETQAQGNQPGKEQPKPQQSPPAKKKVNFFSRQNANKEQKAAEQKKAREMATQQTIIKDKRLMSKEDMIHLLEDSIGRAFTPKDLIIKSNCQ